MRVGRIKASRDTSNIDRTAGACVLSLPLVATNRIDKAARRANTTEGSQSALRYEISSRARRRRWCRRRRRRIALRTATDCNQRYEQDDLSHDALSAVATGHKLGGPKQALRLSDTTYRRPGFPSWPGELAPSYTKARHVRPELFVAQSFSSRDRQLGPHAGSADWSPTAQSHFSDSWSPSSVFLWRDGAVATC